MATQSYIHVVLKAHISNHTVVPISTSSLKPLEDGHARVRSRVISLSNNNLTYALLGTLRNWWDAYPVPTALGAPYNDRKQYGICPAWGYAEVLESRVIGIIPGALVWGFWPTSDYPVDLKLVPADARGHWYEISEHREQLMTLYQRYVVKDNEGSFDAMDESVVEKMAFEAAWTVFQAGYLLNKAVFGEASIHPADAGHWDATDSDLTSAVVICLSASGKTARAFIEGLMNNRSANTGPLGMLAIASTLPKDAIRDAPFPTAVVSYESMVESPTLDFIGKQKPRKIVIADFGGRGDSPHRLSGALQVHFDQKVEIVTIGVGGSAQIRTPQQLGELARSNARISSKIQMNTSDVRDALIRKDGAEKYFSDLTSAWEAFSKSDMARGLKIKLGQGVDGIEGGWTALCKGTLGGDVALAYKMS